MCLTLPLFSWLFSGLLDISTATAAFPLSVSRFEGIPWLGGARKTGAGPESLTTSPPIVGS